MDAEFVNCIIKDIHYWLNIDPSGSMSYYVPGSVRAGCVDNHDINTKIEKFKATSNIRYIFFQTIGYTHFGYSICDNKIKKMFYYPFGYSHFEFEFKDYEEMYDIHELYSVIKQRFLSRSKPKSKPNKIEKITEYLNSLPTCTINYMISLNKPIKYDEIIIEI